MLAFDITQFFLLLNHQLLSLILDKAGFNPRIFTFFSNYLIDRQTQYIWNNFVSPFFRADVGVRQGSALSPILYIITIFHIFKKRTNSLLSSIFVSTFSFIDNGLFISQKKSYEKLNTNLFFSYSIISFLFEQFGLIIKHNKSKVFYFSRMMKNYKLPSLNLRPLRGYLL